MVSKNSTRGDKKILDASEQEGFCVLVQGNDKRSLRLYQHPIKKLNSLPTNAKAGEIFIGHMAYPNPTLKNQIPARCFYGYTKNKKITLEKNEELEQLKESYKTFGALEQSVNKKQYFHIISQIKKLLIQGEVYQLNYAIRFRKKFRGNAFGLFLKWTGEKPNSFSGFLNAGEYQILSHSPERLFRLKGREIITSPIKGTAAKAGGNQALEGLLKSEKERAELEMITDLARNDIGQVCEFGTLKLRKHREILELANLWHTYSEVSGKISSKIKLTTVIDALFPGGSITGCPKKRAMEHIEKLEGLPRNIFTGSLGWVKKTKIGWDADFNIAIRTALIKDGHVEYWAGGGITIDSDPEAEYNECLLKAEQFLKFI